MHEETVTEVVNSTPNLLRKPGISPSHLKEMHKTSSTCHLRPGIHSHNIIKNPLNYHADNTASLHCTATDLQRAV